MGIEDRKQRKRRERKGVETWRERDGKRAETEGDRQTEGKGEGPLVSSFLLVIGFSDWSKLFFSILLLSLSLSLAGTFFSPPWRER